MEVGDSGGGDVGGRRDVGGRSAGVGDCLLGLLTGEDEGGCCCGEGEGEGGEESGVHGGLTGVNLDGRWVIIQLVMRMKILE